MSCCWAVKAYRARPAKGTNLPVVLVVQEIFGIHPYIQDVCRRLVRLGYLAVAPSLFDRQGDETCCPTSLRSCRWWRRCPTPR